MDALNIHRKLAADYAKIAHFTSAEGEKLVVEYESLLTRYKVLRAAAADAVNQCDNDDKTAKHSELAKLIVEQNAV